MSFINKTAKKQALQGIDSVAESDRGHLHEKFYYLDHTAEVLENYRRIQENEIFDKVLHGEREKKAALKLESRKMEHLLETSEFNSYGYF